MNLSTIILITVGLISLPIGINLIMKQDTSKMNYNQYQYVKQENLKKFARNSGISLLILSLSILITGILNYFFTSNYCFIVLLIGVVLYCILLILNQKKYNKEPENLKEKG